MPSNSSSSSSSQSNSNSSISFRLTVRVDASDIDRQGHVNNITYLRWVQDIATAHWQAVASAEDQTDIIWVVLRHEIDYKAPALLDDELIIQTFVGQATGITFERHVEIIRAGDEKLLARARTLWCPLNRQTGKPQRVSPALRAQFSTAKQK